jgi:serine protease Do
MQETSNHAPTPKRLWRLMVVLLFLSLALVAPYLAQQVQYGLTRGQLRARSDAAAEQLSALAGSAQLVKLSDTSRAFRLVAQRIESSVVHIDTRQGRPAAGSALPDEWNHPYRRGAFPLQGQGSGVIVDEAGYVLTNHHVVNNADEIEVKLSDGRTISKVEVVGYDVLTDLAVLKIEATGLTAAAWGDSRELEVGDWVLAMGNPYGLDRTMTAGIVSAKQRRGFSQTPYQDFLQTDAAVNPGNSGGPLVDIAGNLVGITTAIIGRSYQGISFAIPSEVAREVYDRLRENGTVPRGWLGIEPRDVRSDQVDELKLPGPAGALVVRLLSDSPAAKAGLQVGDVIIEWNGEPVLDATELPLLVAATEIGSKAKIVVIRDGKRRTLEAIVGERPEFDSLQPDDGR